MTPLLSIEHTLELASDLHPVVRSYEGFRQNFSVLEAKVALIDSPIYSHLILPAEISERFIVVFMGQEGRLHHDFIKLIDKERAIFRNGQIMHVGPLVKVIRDVMDCPMNIQLPSSILI